MKNVVIHIGFPKTGSTYLQSYFDQHPDVFHDRTIFSNYVKTGNIIAADFKFEKKEHNFLSEELLSIWQGQINNSSKVSYKMSYLLDDHRKKVAEGLKQLFLDAKILIIVRGYESLLRSLYSEYLLLAGTRSFNKFLVEEITSIKELYHYDRVIQLYQEVFGKENVIILPFEMLKESPNKYIAVLSREIEFPKLEFQSAEIHRAVHPNLYLGYRSASFFFKIYQNLHLPKYRYKLFQRYSEWLHNIKENYHRNRYTYKKTIPEYYMRQFKNTFTLINELEWSKDYRQYYNYLHS